MVDKIEKLWLRKVFNLKIIFKLNPLKISQKSKKVVVLLCPKKKCKFKGSVLINERVASIRRTLLKRLILNNVASTQIEKVAIHDLDRKKLI